MIKDIFSNYGTYIFIGLGVIIAIIIILLIFKPKKEKVEEDNSSILDINIDGVVDKDFNYGYSKEETVVMKPVKKSKKKK